MSGNAHLLRAAIALIPRHLLPEVATSPKSGAGVHRWLFSTARKLQQHMEPPMTAAVLRHAVRDCGRVVPDREIADAIRNSRIPPRTGATSPGGPVMPPPSNLGGHSAWPSVDPDERRKLIAANPFSVTEMQQGSPESVDQPRSSKFYIDRLFPGDPLLCCGLSPAEFRTKAKSMWGPELEGLSLIVPSTMKARTGITKEGRKSQRCLDNTGSRRFLVVEFDAGTLDEQASLLLGLLRSRRLVMVVHSGGKSLHGWFDTEGDSEVRLRAWFAGAVRLGADPATWLRCQMVRMPQGIRRVEGRPISQQVVWFAKGGAHS